MVYSIQNNAAYINGANGIYDGKIADNSVRYGRNAAANHFEYLKNIPGKKPAKTDTFECTNKNCGNLLKNKLCEVNAEKVIKETDEYLNSLPPLDFEYRYMPEGANGKNIDKMALLGSAYEEMGRKLSIPVQELNEKMKSAYKEADTKALDINSDGKIDVAEYSISNLTSDMLSKSDTLDAKNITGTVNKDGMYKNLAYVNPKNYAEANKNFTDIYNAYNLGETQKAFEANPNNLLDIQA